jgi:quercetin dioxygenase-like cupin family protein
MPASTTDLRIDPANETIRIGPLTIRFVVTGEQSNGSVAAFEVTIPGGRGLATPPHSHDRYDETIYCTAGVITWTIDGQRIELGPGQTLCIPRGAVHRFENNTTQDATAFSVITPAAIGPEFFRESAAVINAAAGGPPDRAKLTEIMLRYGLTPAPPPPHP